MDRLRNDASSEQERSEAKMVLVVEDDADIGDLIVQALLLETPYQAMLVSDGFQTLKIIRDVKPQLLLLDYQLPLMNGIELYDQICEMEELKDISTLFMSAAPPMGDLQKRNLPIVVKPFDLNALLQMITQLLV